MSNGVNPAFFGLTSWKLAAPVGVEDGCYIVVSSFFGPHPTCDVNSQQAVDESKGHLFGMQGRT